MCDQEGHVYASADGDEILDGGNTDTLKSHPEDCESETDQKGSEVEYAEINDPRLPRYTDIFKENMERKEDPFNRASAPPLYSSVTPQSYTDDIRAFAYPDEQRQMSGGNTESLTAEADDVFEEANHTQLCSSSDLFGSSEFDPDAVYYNVREKKRKARRSSGSSNSGSINSHKQDIKIQKTLNGGFSKVNTKKTKSNGKFCVEMIVKSSSASETLAETQETPLTSDNGQSTPSDSGDVIFDLSHIHPASLRSMSSSSMPRSDSISACSVGDSTFKSSTARNKSRQKPVRGTSKGSNYDNHDIDASIQLYAMNGVTPYQTYLPQSTSIPTCRLLTNAEILACCDPTPRTIACIEPESLESRNMNTHKLSFHVDCVCDPTSEDCLQCSKYDRLQHQPDSDASSLHIYLCLEDVKHDFDELMVDPPASFSNVPEINCEEGSRITRQIDLADAGVSTDQHHRHAH